MPPPEPDPRDAARHAIFVYYKVARENAGPLQQAFARLVSGSSGPTALFRHARLLRRADKAVGAPEAGAAQAGAPEAGATQAGATQAGAAQAEEVHAEASGAGGQDRSGSGLQTWMEVYWLDASLIEPGPSVEGRPPDWQHQTIVREIDSRARAAGLVDLIHGERHCEAFESCA